MLGMIRNDLGIAILHNLISRHYQSNADTVVGHPEGRQFMIYDIYASSWNSFSAFFRIMKPQCLPSILKDHRRMCKCCSSCSKNIQRWCALWYHYDIIQPIGPIVLDPLWSRYAPEIRPTQGARFRCFQMAWRQDMPLLWEWPRHEEADCFMTRSHQISPDDQIRSYQIASRRQTMSNLSHL